MSDREQGVGWGKQPRAAGEPMVSNSNEVETLGGEVERLRTQPIVIEPTGHRVPHPPTCGACHGVGCPEFRLVEPSSFAPHIGRPGGPGIILSELPTPPPIVNVPTLPTRGEALAAMHEAVMSIETLPPGPEMADALLRRLVATGYTLGRTRRVIDASCLVDYFQVAYALGWLFEGDDESQTEVGFWDVVVALNEAFPQFDWHNVMTDGPARS